MNMLQDKFLSVNSAVLLRTEPVSCGVEAVITLGVLLATRVPCRLNSCCSSGLSVWWAGCEWVVKLAFSATGWRLLEVFLSVSSAGFNVLMGSVDEGVATLSEPLVPLACCCFICSWCSLALMAWRDSIASDISPHSVPHVPAIQPVLKFLREKNTQTHTTKQCFKQQKRYIYINYNMYINIISLYGYTFIMNT